MIYGNQLTYKWSVPDGITISSSTAVKPTFTAPVVATNTAYTFTLVVNDGTVDSPADQVVITVRQAYKAPVANAGTDQSVNEGTVVTMDGSASTNTNGNSLTYKWSAPAGIILSSTTSIKPWFTAPEVTVTKNLAFTLVVNDGVSDSPADEVVITVKQVNKAPVANAGTTQTVNEGAIVTLDGSASSDADSNPLTFTWSAPAGITLSSASVANPVFTAPLVHRDSTLVFSLVVNDGLLNSNTASVTINIKNLNILNTEALILKTVVAGADSVKIDQTMRQVLLYMPYGFDITALAPTFQLSDLASINPSSGSKSNFTSPVSYVVTAEDGTTSKTYSISVFIPTVTLKRTVVSGWNWISLGVIPPDLKVATVFQSLSLSNLDYIRSSSSSSVFYLGYGWFGDMSTIPQSEAMIFKKSISDVFSLTGKEINPTLTSIPVLAGWNRIGYLLKGNAALDAAFDGSTLPPGEILLKSKDASAIYFRSTGWIGDLDSMKVLNGYMMKTLSNGTIRYKAKGAILKSARQLLFSRTDLYNSYQLFPSAYENSANLIGEVVSQNGKNMIGKGDILIAYCNNEPRGVTEACYVPELNRYIFLLTMFSNSNQDNLTFRFKTIGNEYENYFPTS